MFSVEPVVSGVWSVVCGLSDDPRVPAKGDRCGLFCACVESGVCSLDNLRLLRAVPVLVSFADWRIIRDLSILCLSRLVPCNPPIQQTDQSTFKSQPATCWFNKRLLAREGTCNPTPSSGMLGSAHPSPTSHQKRRKRESSNPGREK